MYPSSYLCFLVNSGFQVNSFFQAYNRMSKLIMFRSQISKFTITNSWCLDPCLSKIFISAGFQRFYNFYFCWKEGIFLIKTCQRFDKKHGVYIRIDQCWVDGSLIIMEGPNRTTGLIQETNSESKKIAFVYNL